MLNPGLDYGKEFFPHEIEVLLATGLTHAPQRHTVSEPAQVLLGQPKEYPTRLFESPWPPGKLGSGRSGSVGERLSLGWRRRSR